MMNVSATGLVLTTTPSVGNVGDGEGNDDGQEFLSSNGSLQLYLWSPISAHSSASTSTQLGHVRFRLTMGTEVIVILRYTKGGEASC